MYALKRIVAYAIDYALLLFVSMVCLESALTAIHDKLSLFLPTGILSQYASLFITYALPAVLLGTLIGLVGWTPGKFVMFLRVRNRQSKPIGLANGLLREIVKAVSFCFFFGMIWALYGLITSESTFYDDWLGCSVDDLKPTGLTETQKNWRKQMRS